MPNNQKKVSVKVQKAKKRDVGKNIIRIDSQIMEDLNVKSGDYILIKGNKESLGIAWPSFPKDNGLNIVRFDGRLMSNTGANINDTVEICKIIPKTAEFIILEPSSVTIRTNPRFESFVKRKLNNYPVTLGDVLYIGIGINKEISFKVAFLTPKDICVIKQETTLQIFEGDFSEAEKIKIEGIRDPQIRTRKLDHLRIPLEFDVQHLDNYFNDIKLIPHTLPEMEKDSIDLSAHFTKKKISAPICIAAITGGHPLSSKINEILAKSAQQENIILSVGSQRIGLEDPSTRDSFEIARKLAPDVPIIGNIGIGQISDPNFKIDNFNECITMIKADAMAIHFNALHELLQSTDDISFANFMDNFKYIRESTKIPIIAKEVGCGIDHETALLLDQLGFDIFDVGGAGGTSFAAIESKRNKEFKKLYSRNPADTFKEWGIPTPICIIKMREITQKPIIATGGLRNGEDIAKAICLGADFGGLAYNFLSSAWKDTRINDISNTIKEIQTLKNELISSMWLMNIKTISELKNKKEKRVILGKLYQWLNQ